MTAIFGFIPTLLAIFNDLPMVFAVLQLIEKAINDAEATGQTSDQKMAAVLNDVEAFLTANYPAFAAPFETIAGVIESVVNDIVAILNLFKKAAPAPAA